MWRAHLPNPVAVSSQVHICCLAFREPPASGGSGGALKCLCELFAHDEVFRQRTYLYGLYRLYLSDAAARAAQPVRAEADGGAEAAPPTQGASAGAATDVPGGARSRRVRVRVGLGLGLANR